MMKQSELFARELLPWEEADRDDVLCAQVALNRPMDMTYDYVVPDGLRGKLQPGMRVRVPFGRGDHVLVGYCVGLGRPTHREGLKSVCSLVDAQPLLSAAMLELTRWIAERYLCSWGQVLESVVPAGVKKQAGTREAVLLRLNREAWEGVRETASLTPKQRRVIEVLEGAAGGVPLEEVRKGAGCGPGPIAVLRRQKLVLAEQVRTARGDEDEVGGGSAPDLRLNADQQKVLERIKETLAAGAHKTFLLHGVTGSGKTEVYIQAIREVVSYGRQAIVLVPEISLTPQTIRRFKSRFTSVAVLHSHLTDVERHRHWQHIASGRVQVVVGARSAVFAPTPQLGLIVIDEEHEHSFKQDNVPRYHAREVARKRAELAGVPLILGSATPTLESWERGLRGADELLRLPRRVEGLPMPPVVVVDIRHDPYCSKGHALGRALSIAMQHALEQKGQVILFLNLRGYSPLLWCRSCGGAVKCPHCDVTLTWHRDQKAVLCHFCDYETLPPRACPSCNQPGIRYLGSGTERLEQEVRAKFGAYRVLRMDSDSMRRRGSHDEALEAFRKGEVQILLGTQMITKGLDFPNVTLVGVVQADTVLHQPDLRASERTFQLIAQVAGRTGRSARGGRVLVQTSCPAEPAILLAAKHDYVTFATGELAHRKELRAPPFEHLARVILRGPQEADVRDEAMRLAEAFRRTGEQVAPSVRILGPAPAPAVKLKGNFRYHLQLSSGELGPVQALWHAVARDWKCGAGEVEFQIDVDPLNLR